MNNWKENPDFKAMDSRKQRMVELLFNTLHGKSLETAIPILSNWKAQLNSENITFTKAENQLLTNLFISELSPEQRRKFELIRPFIH